MTNMGLSQRQLCEYFGWDYKAIQRGLGGFPHERHRAERLKVASQRWRECAVQDTIAKEAKAKGLSTHEYVQQKTGWISRREVYYPPFNHSWRDRV